MTDSLKKYKELSIHDNIKKLESILENKKELIEKMGSIDLLHQFNTINSFMIFIKSKIDRYNYHFVENNINEEFHHVEVMIERIIADLNKINNENDTNFLGRAYKSIIVNNISVKNNLSKFNNLIEFRDDEEQFNSFKDNILTFTNFIDDQKKYVLIEYNELKKKIETQNNKIIDLDENEENREIRYNKALEKMIDQQKERNEDIDKWSKNFKDDNEEKIKNIFKDYKTKAIKELNSMKDILVHGKKLSSVLAELSTSEGFGQLAKNEKKLYSIYNILGFLSIIVGAIVSIYINEINTDIGIKGIQGILSRFAIFFVCFIPGFCLLRESNKYRQTYLENRKKELNIVSFEPWIERLDEDDKKEILKRYTDVFYNNKNYDIKLKKKHEEINIPVQNLINAVLDELEEKKHLKNFLKKIIN